MFFGDAVIAAVSKVAIYRTLRFGYLSRSVYRFTEFVPRSRNPKSFYNSGHVGCMVRASPALAPSLTHCNGHQMTSTVPAARFGITPDQRHSHHRNGHGLGLTHPFAVTPMILLRAMPRHLLITHQGMHINSKLLAHLPTNNIIECGHRPTWAGAGGSVCETRGPCTLNNVSGLAYWSV